MAFKNSLFDLDLLVKSHVSDTTNCNFWHGVMATTDELIYDFWLN